MACDPRSDTAVHDSHAARVGAGEPRAAAATRRMEGASATPTADGDGPALLGRAVEAVEELGGILCRWCGPRQWCGGTVRPSGAIGHGRVDTDGVGPRLGGKCGISFGG